MTILSGGLGLLAMAAGCCVSGPDEDGNGGFNATDPGNSGASYIGSAACKACHPAKATSHRIHGHGFALQRLTGAAPSFPPAAIRAGVPNPPAGKAWTDLRYVIGGYTHMAQFIDGQGYVMTDGVDGVNTQWNLEFLANGTVPAWASYLPDQATRKSYDFACIKCHTTGPRRRGHQDGLPGIQGTFAEAGVQCEACHGPGSKHIPNPPSNILLNSEASFCGTCHSRGDDVNVIPASGGFIGNYEQYQELLASPHANFRCITCHDAHTSTAYDRDNAIINTCQDCHPDQNMAIHDEMVFVQGDYVEVMSCESCHMTFATKSAASAPPAVAGPNGRIGDVKTHIWYINTNNVDYTQMFSADGSTVRKDANGKAAVTVDFVCMRCHTGIGRAFELTVRSASQIAPLLHGLEQ